MSGRILVVDDVEPNRRLLEARLEAEYYTVSFACDGVEAVAASKAISPDLILLDVMMPRMDGLEACRRIKADPATRHIPIVMVTALDQIEDRVAGLEAGADDFLSKPVDDIALLARVKSLLRLKSVTDELRLRQVSSSAIDPMLYVADDPTLWRDARVLVIDEPGRSAERIVSRLQREHLPTLETDLKAAVERAQAGWDLALVNLSADTFDGLRLAARLRSDEATRYLPILGVVDPSDREIMVRALDLGVNDLLARPIEAQELAARVRTQVKRKRYADFLRASLDHTLELAVTDELTGLHNRRYMGSRLGEAIERARRSGETLAVTICDLDHFKRINDTHGHDAGDAVLREFARRLQKTVRAIDYACRFGGEEFVVIMPGADSEAARQVGERIRADVASRAFTLADRTQLEVTVSVGVAQFEPGDDADRILKRADQALYAAKQRGRNRVIVAKLQKRAA